MNSRLPKLQTLTQSPWLYFYTSLLLLALAFGFEQRGAGYASDQQSRLALFQQRVTAAEREILLTLEQVNPQELCKDSAAYIKEQRQLKPWIKYAVVKDSTAIFWSSNLLDPSLFPELPSMVVDVYAGPNGYYLHAQRILGDCRVLAYFQLYSQFTIQNSYLKDGFNPVLGKRFAGNMALESAAGYSAVKDIEGKPIFYVSLSYEREAGYEWWVILLYLLGFIGLGIFIMFYSVQAIDARHFWQGFLFIALVLVALRLVMMVFRFPAGLYAEDMFGPVIYASSAFAPSLGDLFLNVLSGFILIYQGLKYVLARQNVLELLPSYFRNSKVKAAILVLGLMLVMLLATHAVLSILESLIRHSSISFDVSDMLNLSSYSLTGLLISALLFFSHYALVHIFSRYVLAAKVSEQRFWVLFVAACTIYTVGFVFVFNGNIWVAFLEVSYVSALLLAYRWLSGYRTIAQLAWLLGIISIFSSSIFYRYSSDKEKVLRFAFAQKVSASKDINVELMLRDVETGIAMDSFIYRYFTSPLLLKSQLEKHVKQEYFSGYLSSYDLQLFDYDTAGNSFREANRYSYEKLSEVFDHHSSSTLSRYFYHIDIPTEAIRYMARFDVCDSAAQHGYLFILLKPRLAADENIFGEIISELPSSAGGFRQKYSFAIYDGNYLVQQRSSGFAYPVKFRFEKDSSAYSYQVFGKYNHLIVPLDEEKTVVVSMEERGFMRPFSIFSYIFIAYSMLALLVLAINALSIRLGSLSIFTAPGLGALRRRVAGGGELISGLQSSFTNFATRIQFSYFMLVFLALLVSGVLTVRYISQRNKERQSEKMALRIRQIVNSIENERDFAGKISFYEELSGAINAIAENNGTDLSLYAADGRLLAGTRSRIFNEGIISKLMHPSAYQDLRFEGSSLTINRETIGNLEYLSFYAPVFDSERVLLGYLNLPYFSNEAELREEIASFLVNFINLYVFFFAISAILAYFISQRITRPLSLIRDNLATTSLTRRNEHIQYDGSDEIGQLVQQYNRMIDKLADSAEALAKSEREGAWKEMARQIAHEIKNPLTPMKLSIQHLQRAWRDNSERLPETFDRVTQVLIEQIESLSNLAGEFSNFAKMPEANPERFDAVEVVQGVVALYTPMDGGVINLYPPEEAAHVYMDREQLSRVITNLLKNAVEAVTLNGEAMILIRISFAKGFVIIEITDNGRGISLEDGKRIFNPSFSTKSSGMGVGLSISRAIMEKAGGSLDYRSAGLGKGATFVVSIPRLTVNAAE